VTNEETQNGEKETGYQENHHSRVSVDGYIYPKDTHDGPLFAFDPNKITDLQWKQLGVKEKTILTIRRYLAKGGRFRKPEDIRKIYGIPPRKAEELLAWVQIQEPPEQTVYSPFSDKNGDVHRDRKPFPDKPPPLVDINTADTSALIALPGIGSKLASRIILFREKLGGFYSTDQLAEVYGLADSVFEKIRPRLIMKSLEHRMININTVEERELATHPYVGKLLANAIVAFRKQHEPFTSVEELKNIHMLKEEVYMKLAPYLQIE